MGCFGPVSFYPSFLRELMRMKMKDFGKIHFSRLLSWWNDWDDLGVDGDGEITLDGRFSLGFG